MSDSFESIIADSRCTTCVYAHRRGKGPINNVTCRGCMFGDPVTCHEEMDRDLVRRCKELKGGEPRNRCEVADDERENGYVNIGKVETFPGVKADKAQALKVLEEAAEVFGAWQALDTGECSSSKRVDVLNECADVIQSVANLIYAMGERDFAPYMDECRKRNEERGRL